MISNSTLSPTIVGSSRKLGQNSLPSRLKARISYLTLIPTITKVRKNPLKIYYTDKKTPNLCFILSKIGLVALETVATFIKQKSLILRARNQRMHFEGKIG